MTDSLKFGTSGLRGLAVDLLGAPSARYTRAFLTFLKVARIAGPGSVVAVGRDLRASSPEIAQMVIGAIAEFGMEPHDCGELSTPALALYAQSQQAAAVMVTGSHIPADRNGLKFYLPGGEITKADELGILESLQGVAGNVASPALGITTPHARAAYVERYRRAFAADSFMGLKIGVFQHSSVLRDDLVTLLELLGAAVIPLGWSEHFIPIDTEAMGADEAIRAREWVLTQRLDALVSTDGDADRPLVADETGTFVRGDVLGILTARFLGADAVVTPVTSISSIEGLGCFAQVVRTKVGSPFVIAGMEAARQGGAKTVVGFEANGGVLLGSDATLNGRIIPALPTRDAMLPILAVLAAARADRQTVSELVATLPPRIARSDRLEHVPQERTAELLALLGDAEKAAEYFAEMGEIGSVSNVDGRRFILTSGDVVHYRSSGNAPEMRCYTEAGSAGRADELLAWGLRAAEKVVR